MADEIEVYGRLSLNDGTNDVKKAMRALIDITGADYYLGTQTVGTSEEALNLGDITTVGYLLIENRDTTNYVTYRPATGGTDTVRIPAGGFALFYAETSAPYVIANTASCILEVLAIER